MLRSAGWESVQAVWPLHARLFAAVAGKGISALDMHPRKLPTRYAAGFRYLDGPACAVARLGAYAHRTASDYLDEPATAGSAHRFHRQGVRVRAVEQVANGATGLDRAQLDVLARGAASG